MSPLNEDPVNESFQKYLKPFLKSNLWCDISLGWNSVFHTFLSRC
jgi:hypothetical protein